MKKLESVFQQDTSLGFLVDRNPDDTLSVWFSDKFYLEDIHEEDIDDIVFGYEPDLEKIQAFSEDELYTLSAQDSQCH